MGSIFQPHQTKPYCTFNTCLTSALLWIFRIPRQLSRRFHRNSNSSAHPFLCAVRSIRKGDWCAQGIGQSYWKSTCFAHWIDLIIWTYSFRTLSHFPSDKDCLLVHRCIFFCALSCYRCTFSHMQMIFHSGRCRDAWPASQDGGSTWISALTRCLVLTFQPEKWALWIFFVA